MTARNRHRVALFAIAALGVALRVALAWRTEPFDSYDNHFEPIYLLLSHGSIPDKFACFQCYHPPVFYVVQAGFAALLTSVGVPGPAALKALQYANCAFASASLLVVLAIVEEVPVAGAARLGAAAIVAALPRHVYLAAAHANDSLAVLLVTIAVWILVKLGDGRRAGWWPYFGMAAVASLAFLTKYNALAVVPALAAGLVALPALRDPACRRGMLARAAVAVGIPSAVVAIAMASNLAAYGSALPGNDAYARHRPDAVDLLGRQPRERATADFVRFEPWRSVGDPLLHPGELSQFWTLMHASTWFDNDAKFVQYVADDTWVDAYYRWLRGEGAYPNGEPGLPLRRAKAFGSVLNLLGVVVVAVAILGAVALARLARRKDADGERWRAAAVALSTLAAANVAGLMIWVARVPLYSAMKGTYLLPSIATLGVLVALGLGASEAAGRWRWAARTAVGAVVMLTTLHVWQIVIA